MNIILAFAAILPVAAALLYRRESRRG